MRRSEALAGLVLAPVAALSACAPTSTAVVATKGSPLRPTVFGSQIYPSDDIAKTMPLLAACGSKLVRVNVSNADFGYFDAVFNAASAHGMRVIAISQYAGQPVDPAAYAADAVTFHRRYAAHDPIWELWNEPNLAHYWGAPPDLNAYANLAIATARALRNAGAREVLSGGTSGIDINWIYGLRIRNVFDVVTGCAVHNYKKPALNEYLQAGSLLPPGVQIYTTEACVVDAGGPAAFVRDLWYVHRYLGLPVMVWCEFRDGTAGSSPPYTDPMGLVTADYSLKAAYYVAQSLVNDGMS
jgi:hypothetical protein